MMNTTDFISLILSITLMTVAVVTILRYLRAKSPGKRTKRQTFTLEHKLDILADCGFRLATPFSIQDLLESWGREAFEQPGFDLVLVGLGMTEEREPWRNHCLNLWHFDTECIEDRGDYKRITERMVEMTQGALVLENIEDNVDVEQEIAWLSFTWQEQSIKLDLAVNDDWVDWLAFRKLSELLEKTESRYQYVIYKLGGQDCLIGCVSQDQLEKINAYGINFIPLESSEALEIWRTSSG